MRGNPGEGGVRGARREESFQEGKYQGCIFLQEGRTAECSYLALGGIEWHWVTLSQSSFRDKWGVAVNRRGWSRGWEWGLWRKGSTRGCGRAQVVLPWR